MYNVYHTTRESFICIVHNINVLPLSLAMQGKICITIPDNYAKPIRHKEMF